MQILTAQKKGGNRRNKKKRKEKELCVPRPTPQMLP